MRVGMKALGVSSAKSALAALAKSDRRKIGLAGILRAKTSVGNGWIATRLAMGHPGSVSRMLSTGRAHSNLASEQNPLTKVLFPNEKSVK